jgi:uncharacterized damage-inducible protein DinB
MTVADLFETDRTDPPRTAGERDTLTTFLDYYRDTLATKCHGLDAEQLSRRAVEPSSLTLLGVVRHMGEVERGWFRGFAGEQTHARYYSSTNPDGDFDDVRADDEQVHDAYRYWQDECTHAREVTAAHALDDTFTHPRSGDEISLRWVLVHMIEEYARHCGHADFLRERVDGATGD